ncbi:hypothetical protein AB0I94_35805 [Streptomyces sp. NPDC050147]|uniref:hypothetical protein n=1 Tax=Streptomyces sp. NPDC050147 TaxID=3155513 RepID=UPI00341A4D5B
MTGHKEADVHQQSDRRLQHALEQALDGLLDVEAGLSEILLSSRHDSTVDSLQAVLDTEAGLAAILPPDDAGSACPADTAQAAVHHLHDLSPAQLLALRSHPEVSAASHALVRTIRQVRDLAVEFDLALDLVLDLAHAIVRDLDQDHTSTYDQASARELALARARVMIRGLDRPYLPVGVIGRYRALERARARAVNITRVLSYDNFDRDLARLRSRARAHDLTRFLDGYRLADRDRNRGLESVPDGYRVDRDRHRVLASMMIDVRTAEVGRAIGLALDQVPPALRTNDVAALNDFTTANLSSTDLTGVDLSGIRWSEHGTRWPPPIDVDALKARSDETRAGSGIWIVRSGTTTAHDLAGI